MTKYLTSLILDAILFGLIVTLAGSQIEQLYGSIWTTLLLSALIIGIATLVLAFLGMIVFMVVAGVFTNFNSGVFLTWVTTLFTIAFVFICEAYLIRLLPNRIDWFPVISWGWIWTYILTGFVLRAIFTLGEKK